MKRGGPRNPSVGALGASEVKEDARDAARETMLTRQPSERGNLQPQNMETRSGETSTVVIKSAFN